MKKFFAYLWFYLWSISIELIRRLKEHRASNPYRNLFESEDAYRERRFWYLVNHPNTKMLAERVEYIRSIRGEARGTPEEFGFGPGVRITREEE